MSTDVLQVIVEQEEEPLRDLAAPASDEPPPRNEDSVELSWLEWVWDAIFTTVVFFFLVLTLVIWILFGVSLILVVWGDTANQRPNSPFYNKLRKLQSKLFYDKVRKLETLSFYDKVKKLETTAKKYADRVKFIRNRFVILLFTWLVVNLYVPGLKNKLVLGSDLWKWTLLLTLISCGYNLISLASSSLIDLLCLNIRFITNPIAEYYARGLRLSVNLVLLSLSVLLTWILYFMTRHGIRKTPETRDLLHVGTWTFFTLVVASLLWLLKNVLLLLWEADVVYDRFRKRILSARLHQLFLGHLCDSHDQHRVKLFWPEMRILGDLGEGAVGPAPVETEESNKQITTYHIQQMANHFVRLSVASSRDDDGTSLVSAKCKKLRPSETGVDKKDITADDLSKLLKAEKEHSLREKYAKLWLLDLKRENQVEESEKISYENCARTMVKAQKNCLALGHSLSDAKKVVEVLNKVMTALLGAIVMVAWLLLTNIATNKILVLMASPFLAATFIFGEACKRIFEGIVFSFINHPFDVGDLCIIDDKELEVRNMSILTTKFLLIGKKEDVLYPNSILATKSIINLKEEPDPNDHVELKLTTSIRAKKLSNLEDKIKSFLKDETRFENDFTIVVEDIGDCTKMAIQYRINITSTRAVTHSLCLEKKRERKSVLLKRIAEFMEEFEPGAYTPLPLTTPRPKRILRIPTHINKKLALLALNKGKMRTHPGPLTW